MCSSRVRDLRVWKEVFGSHAGAHRTAGLRLRSLWRGVDDPNLVFFLLDVEDRARAQAFLDDPVSAEAGEAAGVLDGGSDRVEETSGDGG